MKIRTIRLALASLFLVLTSVIAGAQTNQGVRYDGVALLDTGRPVQGAAITVCASGSTGTPCTPTTSIFSDAALSVAITQPGFQSGAQGNFNFYAACGKYDISFTGSGLTSRTMKDVQLGPCGTFRANVSRVIAGQGTLMTAAKIVLSAGWGSTASLDQIAGTDAAFRFRITPSGTGIAANPTVTITFSDGTWGFTPICQVTPFNPSGAEPIWVVGGSSNATTLVLGTNSQTSFTPVTATPIGVMITCVGSPN